MTDYSDILEYLTERASIMEHDGGLQKSEAEHGAILEAREKFGDDAVQGAIYFAANGLARNTARTNNDVLQDHVVVQIAYK